MKPGHVPDNIFHWKNLVEINKIRLKFSFKMIYLQLSKKEKKCLSFRSMGLLKAHHHHENKIKNWKKQTKGIRRNQREKKNLQHVNDNCKCVTKYCKIPNENWFLCHKVSAGCRRATNGEDIGF